MRRLYSQLVRSIRGNRHAAQFFLSIFNWPKWLISCSWSSLTCFNLVILFGRSCGSDGSGLFFGSLWNAFHRFRMTFDSGTKFATIRWISIHSCNESNHFFFDIVFHGEIVITRWAATIPDFFKQHINFFSLRTSLGSASSSPIQSSFNIKFF